jgi:hypothetical protein
MRERTTQAHAHARTRRTHRRATHTHTHTHTRRAQRADAQCTSTRGSPRALLVAATAHALIARLRVGVREGGSPRALRLVATAHALIARAAPDLLAISNRTRHPPSSIPFHHAMRRLCSSGSAGHK